MIEFVMGLPGPVKMGLPFVFTILFTVLLVNQLAVYQEMNVYPNKKQYAAMVILGGPFSWLIFLAAAPFVVITRVSNWIVRELK